MSGPQGTLLTGNLSEFAVDPLAFLTRVARNHGPMAALRFGRSRAVLLSDPALIEEVLVKRRTSFIKARPLRAQSRLFGNGLLLSEGDTWKKQRRFAQPAFHPARLVEYAPIVVNRTTALLENWGAEEVRDIHGEMKNLLMGISAETMFGSEVAAHAARIGTALESTMERYASRRGMSRLMPERLPTATTRRYVQGVTDIDSFVTETIAARRRGPNDHSDLLSLLLAARDENGNPMNASQLRDESITLFVGAFDTPALCLSWTWWLLAMHPEIAARLRGEVDLILGGAPPTAADVSRLALTRRIVKESMRLYPPAWLLSREAAEDTEIGGVAIHRGTSVLMSQWVMHRDERFFQQPLEFLPDRWTAGTPAPPKFAYFPFGGGPRVCIGAAFATMEITMILAMMAQRFRFEMAQHHEVVPRASMTLRPRGGVPARIVPRAVVRSPAISRPVEATA